jgi:hypothetical protein
VHYVTRAPARGCRGKRARHRLSRGGPLLRELLDKRNAEIQRKAEQRFRDVARRNGGRAEWRSSQSDPAAAVRLSARYADLVVAGQPEAGDEGDLRGSAA